MKHSEVILFMLICLVSIPVFGRSNTVNTREIEIDYEPRSVKNILKDGQGDFDPWNAERWSAWYENGLIYRSFEIDTTVRFAERSTTWKPDLSKLLENTPPEERFALFTIDGDNQGIEIDGNGLVIDGRHPDYYDRTVDEAYAEGYGEMKKAIIDRKKRRCFLFDLSNEQNKNPNTIHHFTIKGFGNGIKVSGKHDHPLLIKDCVFARNNFGTYFNGSNIKIENCVYLENGSGGVYNGSGSHHITYRNNSFRDNDYVWPTNDECPHRKNYADILFDCSYKNIVEGNQFLPSQASGQHYRAAITTYRNQGDRDNAPYGNIIRNNTFDGYSIAVHLGTRMGKIDGKDIADAGRDYSYDNIIANNDIRNTPIGIKINTSGNTIAGNTFTNVRDKIVLHCIYYNLTEITINDQQDDSVRFWFTKDDYDIPLYTAKNWFSCHDDRNGAIRESEKLIHVRTDHAPPLFPNPGTATFVNAPSLLLGDEMKDRWKMSKKPIDIAVGNFYPGGPGDELAVIFDEPVMNENGTLYYSIIIYLSNGMEVYRSGRNTNKWAGIACGDFLGARGEEIAAFTQEPVNGNYPVYIFRRGYKEPHRILMQDNTKKIKTLCSGNFNTTNSEDEIALIFEDDSTLISYVDVNSGWSSTTLLSKALIDIAGGNFDGDPLNGDEISGITSFAPSISFYRPGETGAFSNTATEATSPWTAIGSGNFDGNSDDRDEVVVTSSLPDAGIYPVRYYIYGEDTHFKTSETATPGVPIATITGGALFTGSESTPYDKIDGIQEDDFETIISNWGDHAVILPVEPQTTAIPVFWMSAEPSGEPEHHVRVTPLTR